MSYNQIILPTYAMPFHAMIVDTQYDVEIHFILLVFLYIRKSNPLQSSNTPNHIT